MEKDPNDSMHAGYSVPFGDDPDDSFYSGYSIPTQAVGRPKKTKHSYLEIGEGATPGDAVEIQTDDVHSVATDADIVTSGLTATDGDSKATDMAKDTLPASSFGRMRSVYNGFAEADASGELQGAQTRGVQRHSAAAADYQGYGESTVGGDTVYYATPSEDGTNESYYDADAVDGANHASQAIYAVPFAEGESEADDAAYGDHRFGRKDTFC